jgi:hypothetical protein
MITLLANSKLVTQPLLIHLLYFIVQNYKKPFFGRNVSFPQSKKLGSGNSTKIVEE